VVIAWWGIWVVSSVLYWFFCFSSV
jgi:hypothetical protein